MEISMPKVIESTPLSTKSTAPNAHGERERCDELKDAGYDDPGRSTLALVLFQNGGKLRAERGSSRCSLCISRDCSPPGTQFISVLK